MQAPARRLAFEMDEAAEGLVNQRAFPDRHFAALDLGLPNTPDRAAIAARGALEQLKRGRGAAAKRGVGGWVQRVAHQEPAGISRGPRRAQGSLVQLVKVIKHARPSR